MIQKQLMSKLIRDLKEK